MEGETIVNCGKEILLKSVDQAINVYAMSIFKTPKGVCKSIVDAISQFWWSDDEQSKNAFVCMVETYFPKREGGMGFRDFHYFNVAMLAR
jgi:hypothetical protein